MEQLDIAYVKHEHPAVFTCEEAERYYKDIEGGKSKNLLLRNKKATHFYLVVAEDSKKIDLKSLTLTLGEDKFSFASPERMMDLIGLTPGSVSPFGLINDLDKKITVVVDEDLCAHDFLNFHPNDNTATLEITTVDFKKFLEWCGNKIIYFT